MAGIRVRIEKAIEKHGYTLRFNHDFLADKDFMRIYRAVRPYTVTTIERIFSLYQGVGYVIRAKIPGDFVECGVWKGGSAMVMALALKHFKDDSRTIYLYDTYEGAPDPNDEDVFLATGERAKDKKLGWMNASKNEVVANMGSTGYQHVKFVKGKVEDTVPGIAPKKISLLRLDTDWYGSTKHELKHLYPRLSKGGLLVLDDYGTWKGARKAVDEYFAKKPLFLSRIDNGCHIAVKP